MINKNDRCPLPWQQINVDYLGNVRPCCALHPKYTAGHFGNINNNSIYEIWNGLPFQEIRKAWVAGSVAGTPCETCTLFATTGIPPYFRGGSELNDDTVLSAQNSRLNEEEYRDGIVVLKSNPIILQFYVSTFCNINCDFCYQWSQKRIRSTREGFDMVDQLTPTLLRMDWIGGEPTIQPELYEWMATLPQVGNPNMALSLVSNGTHIPDAILGAYEKFKDVWINVSLDACDKETYETLRRGAVWEKTYSNLKKMIDIRETHPNFHLEVSCLLQKRNLNGLPEFLHFCLEHRLMAAINPCDSFPVPMRLDIFEDIEKELPEEIDGLLQRSMKEAELLDEAMGTRLAVPTLQHCIALLRAGIQRAASHKASFKSPSGRLAPGTMVLASASTGEVMAYAIAAKDGSFEMRLPRSLNVWITAFLDIQAINEIDASGLRFSYFESVLGTIPTMEELISLVEPLFQPADGMDIFIRNQILEHVIGTLLRSGRDREVVDVVSSMSDRMDFPASLYLQQAKALLNLGEIQECVNIIRGHMEDGVPIAQWTELLKEIKQMISVSS